MKTETRMNMRLLNIAAICLSYELVRNDYNQVFGWTQKRVNRFQQNIRLGTQQVNTSLRVKKTDNANNNSDDIEAARDQIEQLFKNEIQFFELDRDEKYTTSVNPSSFGDWLDASPCRGEECEVSNYVSYIIIIVGIFIRRNTEFFFRKVVPVSVSTYYTYVIFLV